MGGFRPGQRAHDLDGAGLFGIEVDEGAWRVDGRAVMERVRRERDRFVGFVVRDSMAIEHRIEGRARFVGPTTLQVDDHTIVEAKAVVIATGSSPWVPPPLDTIREHVIVNDDVFDWEDLPRSIAVFGTGIIGIELGQALHRLGVRVTFFNPFDVLGPFTDPAIGAKAREVLGGELDLNLGATVHAVTPVDGGVEIRWTTAEGQERTAVFEEVLAAAGRHANVKGLGLEATGAHLDKRGLPGSDLRTMQVGDLPIFIAGDVAGHRPLLHEAADEGRIAGANAARWPDVSAAVRRTPLAVAFTHPQMGMVGARFADLAEGTFEVGEVSYDDQGRSRVMGINSGLVRIYARRHDCRLVGAEMFGPRVEHTAHLLAWAVQQGMNVNRALNMPFYHPVVEEGIRTALRDLAAKLRVEKLCPPEDCGDSAGM